MSVTAGDATATTTLPLFTVRDCSVDRQRVAEILMVPASGPEETDAALDRWAAEEFRRANQNTLDAIATQHEVTAALDDARSALRQSKRRRFWTSPAIRVENADAKAAARADGAWFMLGLLILSMALLCVTTTQLIVTERIYPKLPLWATFFVGGAVLSGFLFVPVTFVRTVSLSRVVGLLRVGLSLLGVGIAGYFIYLLDAHAALHALIMRDSGPGGDILQAAGEWLRLHDIEGTARALAIVGEAVCAVAIKLNLDYVRGEHLRYRHVPNPEWLAHDVEVETRRHDVTRLVSTLSRLDAERRAYDEAALLHRLRVHATANVINECWCAEMALNRAALMRRDVPWGFPT